jgi:hypothetical protein
MGELKWRVQERDCRAQSGTVTGNEPKDARLSLEPVRAWSKKN